MSQPQVDDRVLVFKEHWLAKVLAGEKQLELRAQKFNVGHVWLAHKSTVFGSATIASCKKLSLEDFQNRRAEHRIYEDALPYKATFGLDLKKVLRLQTPVPFLKLQGQIGCAKIRFAADLVSMVALKKRRPTSMTRAAMARRGVCAREVARKRARRNAVCSYALPTPIQEQKKKRERVA